MQSYDVIVVGGSIGGSALAANLAYLNLRFPDWSKGRPKLKRWLSKFSDKHPDLAEMLPK